MLVTENEPNTVAEAVSQVEDRSSIEDVDHPNDQLVSSDERKRSHQLDQEEVDHISKW